MQQQLNDASYREPGREHIPNYPRAFIAVRIIQLVFSIICLGLSGFLVGTLPISYDALMLFTSLATLIMSVYHMVAWFGPKRLYNYWAILALDVFLLVFWLVSFVLVALIAAGSLYLYAYNYKNKKREPEPSPYDYYDYTDYSSYNSYSYSGVSSDTWVIYGSIAAAAAAFGAFEFILYIVSLSIHGVAVTRHRKAGLHCMPAKTGGGAVAGGGAEKPIQMQPQQPIIPPQQQPMYDQQQQQQYPQQQASWQGVPPSSSPPPQQGMYGGYQPSSPSQVTSQNTGGSQSYVQGAAVPFVDHHGQQQHQYQQQQPTNLYEAHGESKPENVIHEIQGGK